MLKFRSAFSISGKCWLDCPPQIWISGETLLPQGGPFACWSDTRAAKGGIRDTPSHPVPSVPFSCICSSCKDRCAGRASQLPGQQRWTCDLNQQPVITSLPQGIFVQTGRNVIPLLQRTGQEEPSGLWWDSTAASLCWDAPFYWSSIKNGSQGQVGYSQSRQGQACCLVGNEACLGLSLLIILPGIQPGQVFWAWRHTSGHLSFFLWFPHGGPWRPL